MRRLKGSVAERHPFRPWVLTLGVIRNVARLHPEHGTEGAIRRVRVMNTAFPGAVVTGWEHLAVFINYIFESWPARRIYAEVPDFVLYVPETRSWP